MVFFFLREFVHFFAVVVVNLIHFQSKFYEYDSVFYSLRVDSLSLSLSFLLCLMMGFVWKLAYPIFVFNSFMR